MYDTGKIVGGLAVFAALVSLPFWFSATAGTPERRPELKMALDKTRASADGKLGCIYPAAEMREKHMDLLNDWRNEYVRDGKIFYTDKAGAKINWPDGKPMMKSLTNTCIRCHSQKEKFCDECHAFAGATPYCWACHVLPKEGK